MDHVLCLCCARTSSEIDGVEWQWPVFLTLSITFEQFISFYKQLTTPTNDHSFC